jgi:separase
MPRQTTWESVVGQAPSEKALLQAISRKDLFMYFGHGGGEQYIRGHKIRGLEGHATVLLMGCSSGRLHPSGEFDAWGTVNHYLLAGCPSIVANLWDVTDKDIDRFTKEMINHWGLFGGPSHLSLTDSVAQSRGVCILEYLVGAAPVVYGIPVHLEKNS